MIFVCLISCIVPIILFMMSKDTLNVEIGKRLRGIRKQLKITQQEIASGIGISKSFYSNVENGLQQPSFDFLFKLCNKYKTSLDYIVFGNGSMFLVSFSQIGTIFPNIPDEYLGLFQSVISLDQRDREIVLEFMNLGMKTVLRDK